MVSVELLLVDPCTGRAPCGPSWAENFVKQNGPGLKFGGLGRAVNFQPAQAYFVEISRTHSALVHSFHCINMKLLLERVMRCSFHIDDVFLRVIVGSLLPVICYCFSQSLVIRISLEGLAWTSAGLNGPGLINFGGPRAWHKNQRALYKNQRAGRGLEYWAYAWV